MAKRIIKVLGIVIFLFFMCIGIPLIINEMYLNNKGYITVWDVKDVLVFYGTILSFIGTVFLGGLVLYQNERLNKINKNLTEQQYKPILTCTWITSEDLNDQKEKRRSFFKDIKQNSENVMIRTSCSGEQTSCPDVSLALINIGLGPAINIKIFIHKLKSIEGVAVSIDGFKLPNVENFYDDITFENYEYCEEDKKASGVCKIYKDFDLGISEENNRLNLNFNFQDINKNTYSILEFKYENISQTKFTQYMYLGYIKDIRKVQIVAISKVIIKE
jgi:hypothetical protein